MSLNSLKAAFGTDKSKEEDGTWIDVTDTISLKLRRFRSRAAREAAKRFSKQYATAKKRGLTDEQAAEMTTKVMAEAIIVDWKGVEDDNGPLACTFENKFAILSDEEMEDFREFVATNAHERDLFAHELDEDAEGNS